MASAFQSLFSVTFGDIMLRQSQNTARLSFEVQFQALKRRLDVETNQKKEIYNNLDKTLEPVLGGMKRDKEKILKEKTDIEAYLETGRRNVNKASDILTKLLPQLNAAASDVGAGAAQNFDALRNQLNNALRSLQTNASYQSGLADRVGSVRQGANPSGIPDYASFGVDIVGRANAVGVLATGSDAVSVNTNLSTGFAEKLGLLRYSLIQDFDVAKAKQELFVSKLKEIDRQIEKKDADERLVVLKEIQAMEKKNENILKNLSLNFEFQQANLEQMADRTSFLKPAKGSIMNLFI